MEIPNLVCSYLQVLQRKYLAEEVTVTLSEVCSLVGATEMYLGIYFTTRASLTRKRFAL